MHSHYLVLSAELHFANFLDEVTSSSELWIGGATEDITRPLFEDELVKDQGMLSV